MYRIMNSRERRAKRRSRVWQMKGEERSAYGLLQRHKCGFIDESEILNLSSTFQYQFKEPVAAVLQVLHEGK